MKDGLGELIMTVLNGSAAARIESLESLRDRLRNFAKERDWDQYHTPKNLSMALIAEAAELIEHFQWVEGDQSHLLEEKTRQAVEEELADILIYLVRISDKLGIDLYAAVERKLEINKRKYPADKVRGSAKKYTEYE
jgi:dCTP diphosphatase